MSNPLSAKLAVLLNKNKTVLVATPKKGLLRHFRKTVIIGTRGQSTDDNVNNKQN